MGRLPKQTVIAEINRLRRYIDDNLTKSDEEIIAELGIKRRRYYRYKEKITEQNKEAWLQLAKEPLEAAALRVKQSLEYCKKICKDVCDKSPNQHARIEAAKKIVECDMMLYKMLEQGPTSKSITTGITKLEATDGADRRLESVGENPVPVPDSDSRVE